MRSKLRKFLIFFVITLAPFARATEKIKVTQLEAVGPSTHIWQAQLNNTTLIWEIAPSLDNNSLMGRLRFNQIDTEQQLEVLARALIETIVKANLLHKHTSLGLDRLQSYPPMSRALTLIMAEKNKNDWDFMRGKPIAPISFNAYVLNQMQKVGAEQSVLIKLLKQHHMQSNWAGVEKVLVKRVRELPWSQELIALGLGPLSKIPVDCIIWLKLQKN